MSILEAMALARPVVATAWAGREAVADGETGFVAPGDGRAVRARCRPGRRPERPGRLGGRGRRRQRSASTALTMVDGYCAFERRPG